MLPCGTPEWTDRKVDKVPYTLNMVREITLEPLPQVTLYSKRM